MALPADVSKDSIRAVYEVLVAGIPLAGVDGATPATTANPVPTKDTNGGAAITGAVMPAGGSGFLGWLSAIWTALTAARPSGASADQVQGNAAVGAAPVGSPLSFGLAYDATQPTGTTGTTVRAQGTIRGAALAALQDATSLSVASVNSITDGGSASVSGLRVNSQDMVFNGTLWDRLRKANIFTRLLTAAASDNATVVKASAGDLCKIYGRNNRASSVFLKLYNKATAPTSSDTPVMTMEIVASLAFAFSPDSAYFSTGLAFRMTTAVADADTGALTAGDITGLNVLAA